MRSHRAVALLGVAFLLAAATLGAVEARAIRDLTQRSTPALNAMTDARSGVRATLAALRGYLATGQEQLKADRLRAWQTEVWPALDAAEALADGAELVEVRRSRRLAADLLEAQWWVEDAAHRPGARPARLLLEEQVAPRAEDLHRQTTAAIERERLLPADSARRRMLLSLADVRGASAASYAALRDAETRPTPEKEETWRGLRRALERATAALENAAPAAHPDQADAIAGILAVAPVYLRLGELVLTIAPTGRGGTAEQLLADEALPRADALLTALATLRDEHLATQARGVRRVQTVARSASLACLVLAFLMAFFSRRLAQSASDRIAGRVDAVRLATEAFAEGRDHADVSVEGDDELADLARGFVSMREALTAAGRIREEQLATITAEAERTARLSELADLVREAETPDALAVKILRFLAVTGDAAVGALWLPDDGKLAVRARHGWTDGDPEPGGQLHTAAAERSQRWLEGLAPDHLRISTGLGESAPTVVGIVPLDAGPTLGGVLELGWVTPPSPAQRSFLTAAAGPSGAALARARAEEESARLLRQTQVQSEELQTQTEELRVTNEELEERSVALARSEARLQTQAEELRVANEELEQRQHDLERRNRDLENASELVRIRAEELERATKYKSEFLANMSHELRTPLNSILILAELLAENPHGTLRPKQVEFARTIRSSGDDLLGLINEVLDLSRVEAGKLDLDVESVDPAALLADLEAKLGPQARKKGVAFTVRLPETPLPRVPLDPARIGQVLRNLAGNAVKFTSEGRVEVRADATERWLEIAVEDTGPGIPEDHQALVFEAFHQVDGTVRRRFGGTGLGLSISKELVERHGGRIELTSTLGVGSTFVVRLPITPLGDVPPKPSAAAPLPAPAPVPPLPQVKVPDLPDGARVLLIVEDDSDFAAVLSDLAEEKGFHPVLASEGPVGLALARRLRPQAMIVDLGLPGMGGAELLAALRADPSTANIPAHVVSAQDRPPELDSLDQVGFLAKPATPDGLRELLIGLRRRADAARLLVVEDDAVLREQLIRLLAREGVDVRSAASAEAARRAIAEQRFDCIVLDLGLPDDPGLELLDELRSADRAGPPVVVYTGRELSSDELRRLQRDADSVVIKTANSPERLLEEVRLFLHGVGRGRGAVAGGKRLEGRRVLLVDDDMRNVYALSELLEAEGAAVEVASDGQEALDALEEHDVDLVVMDMMMPVMDGYEATRRIREQARFTDLPIVALTAKAMKADRIACLEAGASDYLTKPVDVPRLLSVLEVWLGRRR